NQGARGVGKSGVPNGHPTLDDLGITKRESSDAQALADIKRDAPDLHGKVRDGELPVAAARSELKRRARRVDATSEPAPAVNGGDLWRVEKADCLEYLAAQPADSIDLVFGSPPYEDARLYLEDGKNLGVARGTEEWVLWMADVYQAALRACRGLVAFV